MVNGIAHVDSVGIAVAGTPIGFGDVIQRDSVVVNLTGKVLQARIHRTARNQTLIHADLEDMVITSTGTLANGEAKWTLSAALSAHLAALCPADSTRWTLFSLQYHVVDDNFKPPEHHFKVRRAFD